LTEITHEKGKKGGGTLVRRKRKGKEINPLYLKRGEPQVQRSSLAFRPRKRKRGEKAVLPHWIGTVGRKKLVRKEGGRGGGSPLFRFLKRERKGGKKKPSPSRRKESSKKKGKKKRVMKNHKPPKTV